MFRGCSYLETISIPPNVTMINGGAFQDCLRLVKIIIPSNSRLTNLGPDCFRNCQLLQGDFIVPPSVTQISANCFDRSVFLSEIIITNYRNFQSTSSLMFFGCLGLRRITYWNCPGNPPNPLSSAANIFNTAAQNANSDTVSIVYNTSAFNATNVVFGSGSIKEDFCNSDGVKLCSLIACDGEIILTDDSLIDGYIIKTIISTFNKLKEIPYSDVIFESIKNNLTIYLANEQLVQLINKKVFELTEKIINGTLSNDEFKNIFNPYLQEITSNYPEKFFKFMKLIEKSMEENMYLLKD